MQSSYKKQIGTEGFATIPDGVSADDLEQMAADIDEAVVQHTTIRRSRAGIRHALGLGPVSNIAGREELLRVAREVLGPHAFPFRATIFDKSSQSNWLVVWHQDTALPLEQRTDSPGWGPWSLKDGVHYAHAPASALQQIVALRVHIDDSTQQNGPLRVLPGTHTSGVLSDDAIHDLSTRIAPVDCPVPKGGILAMRPLLIHASSKSHTQAPRRVLHVEYAACKAAANPLALAVV